MTQTSHAPSDHLNGWEIRLNAARDSLTRSRYAFIAVTVTAAAFLIVAFNQTASWERSIGSRDLAKSPIMQDMQKELGRQYIRDTTINSSLLGITININDAPVLGAMVLLILTMWFFYSIRRENHQIAYLISDAEKLSDGDLKRAIFHGIASYLVFITISKDDFPIGSIAEARAKQADNRAYIVRVTYRLSLMLPFIAMTAIIISSVASLLLPCAVRENCAMLIVNLKWYEYILVAVTQCIAVIAAVFLLDICQRLIAFDKATGNIINEFGGKVLGSGS